jgi:hypothetical protein
VLGLKPLNPGIDCGSRDPQEAADAQLLPAVIVEFDHLKAGLVPIRMAMIIPQPQVLLARDGTLLPELLDRPVIEGIPERARQDAAQLLVVGPVIERFEMVNLLAHGLRKALSTSWGDLQNRLVKRDAEIISRPFFGYQWDV